MSFDLLVENARIVDGTGAPWVRGAVAVTDGRIDRIATAPEHGLDAETRIDADGSVVCPGFIDAHSYSDLELFADPSLAQRPGRGSPPKSSARTDSRWRRSTGRTESARGRST